jgi:hypothetical protein
LASLNRLSCRSSISSSRVCTALAIAVELGALMLVDGVLDRERVQPELLGQHLEVSEVGGGEVEPHHRRVVLGEVVTDLRDRE